ncbi:hypothetical protein EBB07_26315 [Paenibacillaceae bacterium]|nr:hypothetical protein EBB07_26315 [Paenibacillaceae bacterium]
MKINRIFLFLLLAVGIIGFVLSGCTDPQSEANLSNGITNDQINNESSLTTEQANIVFRAVQELLLSTYPRETDKLDNISIHFTNEQTDNNVSILDVNVEADMTSIRKPEDSPLIAGMQKALSEANNDVEKKAGKQLIDGHLKEMAPYFNKTGRALFPLRLTFENGDKSDFKYELFYLLSISEQVTIYPAKTYFEEHFKEDSVEKEQMGYEMMKEELSSP